MNSLQLEQLEEDTKKTRWTVQTQQFSTFPLFVPPGLPGDALEALLVRIRIEEITYKLTMGLLNINDSDDRSPSPEPVYDNLGHRTNTREQRVREKLTRERQKLVERAIAINPLFRPPPDYKPLQQKKVRKIPIPIDRFPEYNFIGLIIGPRGHTQKALEKDTGAKIAIRGRGSVKDGKIVKDARYTAGEDEELHVLITGDHDYQVDSAADKIRKLLVPIEEGKNEHKRQQLRKLAEINGTLRDHMWTTNENENEWQASVVCAICGELSHPTSDCPMKGTNVTRIKSDSEYENFLAEVEHTKGNDKEQKAYEDFMASIGENAKSGMPETPKPFNVPTHSPYGPPPGTFAATPWAAVGRGRGVPPISPMQNPGLAPWATGRPMQPLPISPMPNTLTTPNPSAHPWETYAAQHNNNQNYNNVAPPWATYQQNMMQQPTDPSQMMPYE
eukprot:TRINITY_DN393_c0_g1_i2.p1 TRINITY_DN393_c0_g1~~TRINITY_DN393_c0_g1_i2.p1  ORF type:complete len:445 (-),score=209.75 TRINITY_DN393_c0_g1_i2:161-1495(-)